MLLAPLAAAAHRRTTPPKRSLDVSATPCRRLVGSRAMHADRVAKVSLAPSLAAAARRSHFHMLCVVSSSNFRASRRFDAESALQSAQSTWKARNEYVRTDADFRAASRRGSASSRTCSPGFPPRGNGHSELPRRFATWLPGILAADWRRHADAQNQPSCRRFHRG